MCGTTKSAGYRTCSLRHIKEEESTASICCGDITMMHGTIITQVIEPALSDIEKRGEHGIYLLR